MSGSRPPRYIGARVARVEDPRFLQGRAKYLDDLVIPGLVELAFVRSPAAHARILAIDSEEAASLPGVIGVFTGRDLEPHVGPLVCGEARSHVQTTRQWALPLDKVRYVGEPVVAVVATSRAIAEDACQLVGLDLQPLPAVLDPAQALLPDAPLIDEELDSNNISHIENGAGDVERAFAEADHVFSKRTYTQRYAAMPLEMRGVIASFDRGLGELTVWTSTQIPHTVRGHIAGPLGIPENRLHVITPAVGGGFGLKSHIFVEELIIPAVARLVDRPVKWVEDRYEHLAASMHAKDLLTDMDIAVRSDGTFTALRARYLTDGGAYSNVPFTPLINVIEGATIATGLYGIENMSYVIDAPLTNKSTNGGYRGVGWGPVHTAREALIDDVARALAMDPVELRLKNFIPDAPYRAPMGQQYDGGSYSASVRRACEIVEYDAFRARQRDAREHGRYLGIGFSPYIEPTGFGVKLAHANLLSDGVHDHARVTVEPDGSVTVSTGLHSHGQGHETTFAQVTADRLGVRLEDVRLVQGDTRTSAFGMGTFASRGAVIGAGLIGNAAGDVRDKLVQLAAHALEASPEDIVVHDGKAFVQGTPAISVTVAELAQTVYYGGSKRPDILDDPALTAVRSYDPGETYTNGVVVAVVDVDAETGMVDLQRVIAVTDCGVMLNPMIVEGQVAGALAQGIGGALYEEIRYSEDGQLETSTLMEYLYPAATEIPSLELHHIETPTPATTEGVKGVGEGGAIAAPVAVLNAVADALHPLGARIDTLPLGPSRVLDAIRAARAEAVAPGP